MAESPQATPSQMLFIPSHVQVPFLTGSRLKPILSEAGQMGLKSLPPDVVAVIDQLKRNKGL
jgi:membrane protein required for colicin V production